MEAQSLRIGTHTTAVDKDGSSYTMTSWTHPLCFQLPKKKKLLANNDNSSATATTRSFVQDILRDDTKDKILSQPAQVEKLMHEIETKRTPGTTTTAISSQEGALHAWIHALRQQATQEDTDVDDTTTTTPPKKKAKTTSTTTTQEIQVFRKYYKTTATHLKDLLKYNRQIQQGSKDVVLGKVLDGVLHGRLARCPLCGGRLQLTEANTVRCGGSFHEAWQVRIPCAYLCPTPSQAPRWQPFYEDEPTEAQKEEMDRLEEQASSTNQANPEAVDLVVRNVSQRMTTTTSWKLDSKASLRETVSNLVQILQDSGVSLPSDPTDASRKIGSMLIPIKHLPKEEIVKQLVQDLGFAQQKEAQAEQQKEAAKQAMACPANAAVVAAFQELAELYFKEGNRNAGATYTKVVAALQKLPFEVTAENAKGLGKGKTKIDNIGKSSADKLYEFVTTGTMAKLEEKRADHA